MAGREIRLLATDFDGTVFHHGGGSSQYPAFAEQLKTLRQTSDCRWLVCTGRSLRSLCGASAGMGRSGIAPDYVLVRHKWIYSYRNATWRPHLPLMFATYTARRDHETQISKRFDAISSELRAELRRARVARTSSENLRAVLRTTEDAQQAAVIADRHLQNSRGLRLACYGQELDVMVLPAEKGLGVITLAQRLNIPRKQVLTIGDARADLYMLSADIADMTGCPSNARPEVIQLVSNRGGHVSRKPAIDGTVDVVRAFKEDTVDSTLPPDWTPESAEIDITQSNGPGGGPIRRQRREALLVWAAGLVGLLAVCSAGIIPYGHLVLKPFNMIIEFITSLFN